MSWFLRGGPGCPSEKPQQPEIPICARHGLDLPLRKGPVRFAVNMPNGLTSHVWGVRTEKKGDAYIFCRETMKAIKVSLHASGRQHIAFTTESKQDMAPGSRYWNKWSEPPQRRPPVPSVKILFPSWATTLGEKHRNAARKKWDTNQILIEGDDELMTTVLFFVVDEGHELNQTGLPSRTLAVLPVRKGKELHVIACREREGHLKARANDWIKEASSSMPSSADMLGIGLTAIFTGETKQCPYLLPMLLDVGLRVTADTRGKTAYDMHMQALVNMEWYRDPEPWEDLRPDVQDAWKVIGADMLRGVPKESKFGQLIADGLVEFV